MEQRREPRLNVNTPVTVTVLGLIEGPVMSGSVLDMSGSGLRLRVPLPIPCGAPVKVGTSDMLMLGEVCRCEPAGDGYEAGVILSQVLTALDELRRMNEELFVEDSQTGVRTRS